MAIRFSAAAAGTSGSSGSSSPEIPGLPEGHQVVFTDPADPHALGIARKGNGFLYGFRNPTTGVLILPLVKNPDGEEDLVLLKTRRDAHEWTPNYQYTIDCIAGKVLAGTEQERLAPCLAQKAGLVADSFTPLAKDVPLGSGYLTERDTIYLASDARELKNQEKSAAAKTDASLLGKIRVPLNRVNQWLKEEKLKGATVSNNVYSALYLLLENRLNGQNPFARLSEKTV